MWPQTNCNLSCKFGGTHSLVDLFFREPPSKKMGGGYGSGETIRQKAEWLSEWSASEWGNCLWQQELTCLIVVHIPTQTCQIPSLLTPGQQHLAANKDSAAFFRWNKRKCIYSIVATVWKREGYFWQYFFFLPHVSWRKKTKQTKTTNFFLIYWPFWYWHNKAVGIMICPTASVYGLKLFLQEIK